MTLAGLDERREDVPLLVRHLLRRARAPKPRPRPRFFDRGEPRIDPELVAALLEHTYTTHFRELESLLLVAMAGKAAMHIALTPAVTKRLVPPEARGLRRRRARLRRRSPASMTSRAPTRRSVCDVLNRLLKKHGIAVRRG